MVLKTQKWIYLVLELSSSVVGRMFFHVTLYTQAVRQENTDKYIDI